jgi:acetyl-CoA carboxylase biotin carboxyl carrier protein
VPKAKRPAASRPRRGKADKALKGQAPASDNSTGALLGEVQLAEVRRLIRIVQRTGIGELEVTSGGRTVRISAHAGLLRGAGVTVASAGPVPASADPGAGSTPAPPAPPAKADTHAAITSPMVGTFYRAPAPDADPYVEVGDLVEVGQTVCIVEAMKLMNEIESEVRGRVVKIMAENAQPVEYGQTLFQVEPV